MSPAASAALLRTGHLTGMTLLIAAIVSLLSAARAVRYCTTPGLPMPPYDVLPALAAVSCDDAAPPDQEAVHCDDAVLPVQAVQCGGLAHNAVQAEPGRLCCELPSLPPRMLCWL